MYTLLTAVSFLFTVSLANAATFTVSSTADSGPNTLRNAVMMATSGDQIFFDASTDGTPITLLSQIAITSEISIFGNGSSNTIIEGNSSTVRIFMVTSAGTVRLTDLTLRNGAASDSGGAINASNTRIIIRNCDLNNNSAAGSSASEGGGAIAANDSQILIRDSDLSNNSATGTSGSGGAILLIGNSLLSAGTTTFGSNSANRAGGAIEHAVSGNQLVALINSVLLNNTAGSNPGNGGALHVTGAGGVQIAGGSASGNIAASEGGALWNGSGTMNVVNMAITNNAANGMMSTMGGGGIYNLSGTLFIRNGTVISGNTATMGSGSGGGVFNDDGGRLVVQQSTISNNSAARAGGGIEDNSGASTTMFVVSSTLNGNMTGSSPGNGGAIHITGAGDASIRSSDFGSNTAANEGGAIWNGAGRMDVISSNITGNSAAGNMSDNGGGGIYNEAGVLFVTNGTTISGNMATGSLGSGGGILNNVGGSLTVSNSTITNNSANRAGGGIEDVSGSGTTIELTNIQLTNNATGSSPGNGGGLHISGSGNAIIRGGVVSGNIAAAEGGGLWNNSGTMTVINAVINGNQANGNMSNMGGGGIYNNGGTLNVQQGTTISNNMADGTAGSGGGIFNATGGTVSVTNSTLSTNSASRAGGGIEDQSGSGNTLLLTDVDFNGNIASAAPGNGGGVHVTGASDVRYVRGTVMNNVAASEGGGLWNGSGTMVVGNVTFSDNEANGASSTEGGGAIYNLNGDLVVSSSTFNNNEALGTSGSGGAIFNDDMGDLLVTLSRFDGNDATRAGGAIEDNSGSSTRIRLLNNMFINNTTGAAPGNGGALHITGPGVAVLSRDTILSNSAANEGGGVWNGSGSMSISECTILNNTSTRGGGVYNSGGRIVIQRSTVSLNDADADQMQSPVAGGGFFNAQGGRAFIFFSTITGNESDGNAAGIANGGRTQIVASTIAGNIAAVRGGGIGQSMTAQDVTIRSSIVAANQSNSGGVDVDLMAGVYFSNGYNLIGNDNQSLFPANSTDLEGSPSSPIDPLLDILQDNGGPTPTHALLTGSPAINAGDPGLPQPDQRGVSPIGQRDIGAFESSLTSRQAPATTPVAVSSDADVDLSVYPTVSNGASGITLDVDGVQEQALTYQVINSAGAIVTTGQVNAARTILDAANLAPDTYAVRIEGASDAQIARFIIVH